MCRKNAGHGREHIDQLIYRYLTEWVVTGIMPENQLYGLESGYADWLVASRYANNFNSCLLYTSTFRLKDNKGKQIGRNLRISNKGVNKY